jgi:F-type H+-transporting ATPase subunit epsilon
MDARPGAAGTTGRIHCTVVTPESAVYEGTVDAVVVPAHDGEVGILPGHAHFLAKLGFGELRVTSNSHTESLFVDGGFVQVAGDRVTVLTDSACPPEALDLPAAEERVEELREKGLGAEFASAHRRLLAMKRVKEKWTRE